MLKNANYNLLQEITQLSKALHRFDTFIEDAQVDSKGCTECGGGCSECTQLWRSMKRRQEEDLDNLMRHFKSHVDRGLVEFKSPAVPPPAPRIP